MLALPWFTAVVWVNYLTLEVPPFLGGVCFVLSSLSFGQNAGSLAADELCCSSTLRFDVSGLLTQQCCSRRSAIVDTTFPRESCTNHFVQAPLGSRCLPRHSIGNLERCRGSDHGLVP